MKATEDSLVCPIKLLLIMSLRLGTVPERSIDELLQHTRTRKSKTIVWSKPDDPVFCEFLDAGSGVAVGKPANSQQLTSNVCWISNPGHLEQKS